MEPVSRQISKKVKPTVIYSDEADEIVKIISSVCSSVTVTTPDYELSSEDSLSDVQAKTTQLKITGFSPYLNLDLDGNFCFFTYSDEIPVAVVNKIEGILIGGSSICWRLFANWWVYFALAMSPAVVKLTPEEIIKPLDNYILSVQVVLGIILSIYGILFVRKKLYYVRTIEKKSSPSFFERNKDSIIVGIITALVSAGATWMITSPDSQLMKIFSETKEKYDDQ